MHISHSQLRHLLAKIIYEKLINFYKLNFTLILKSDFWKWIKSKFELTTTTNIIIKYQYERRRMQWQR